MSLSCNATAREFQKHGPATEKLLVSETGKTKLDLTEAKESEWQWHQLDHTQVCTSLQTNNRASTPPLSLLQIGRPSFRPTNSIKALKALVNQ